MRSVQSPNIPGSIQPGQNTHIFRSQYPHPQNNQIIQAQSIFSNPGIKSINSKLDNPQIEYPYQLSEFHKFFNHLKSDLAETVSACEDAINNKYEIAVQQLPQEIQKQILQIRNMKQYSFKFISQLHEQNQSLICKLAHNSYRTSFEKKNKRTNNCIVENQKNSSKDMEELEKEIYEGNMGKVAQMIMLREEDKEKNDKELEKFKNIKLDIDALLTNGNRLLQLHPEPIPTEHISKFYQQSSFIKSQLNKILSYFSCNKQSQLKYPEKHKLQSLETYLSMNKRMYGNLQKDFNQMWVLLKPDQQINSDIKIEIGSNSQEGYGGENSQINISCGSSQVSNNSMMN